MYYVYVLLSEKGEFYVGYTSNIERRISEHNSGQNESTKGRRWKLAYYEAYASKADAQCRERNLKARGQAKRFLKKRIEHSVEEISRNIC
jgi:putative endonuclease